MLIFLLVYFTKIDFSFYPVVATMRKTLSLLTCFSAFFTLSALTLLCILMSIFILLFSFDIIFVLFCEFLYKHLSFLSLWYLCLKRWLIFYNRPKSEAVLGISDTIPLYRCSALLWKLSISLFYLQFYKAVYLVLIGIILEVLSKKIIISSQNNITFYR